MDNFKKTLNEFIEDLVKSFPDVKEQLLKVDRDKCFAYCKDIYKNNMISIICKDISLFDKPFYFLPEIDLSKIMKMSEETNRNIIWKYLSLILAITCESDMSKTEKNMLINSIKTNEINNKKETETETERENMSEEDVLPGNISELLNGKIGSIAKELAQEFISGGADVNNLLSDPSKLMDMAKNIESKVDTKFTEGNVKEEDLMDEAKQLMESLGKMPGLQEMMQNINNQQKRSKKHKNRKVKKKSNI